MRIEDVVHHQRIRMHGAMIEAIAAHGYERTSVKHVIGLAGVSRRAFYEQFTNKEHCFMQTFDLIVNRTIQRVNGACRARSGTSEQRLRAALKAFAQEIETNSKALSLVLVDALTAGPEGQLRVRRALAASEQLLANGLATPSAEQRLPGPLMRALTGGLRRATFVRLRGWDGSRQATLSNEMLRWTLLFTSPALATLRLRPVSRPPLPKLEHIARQGHTRQGHSGRPWYSPQRQHSVGSEQAAAPASARELLIRAAIELVLCEPYEELSAPHIAEQAGLSIDAFLGLFESPQQCFAAGLDMLGGELLETVAHPDLVSERWPLAVCEAIDRLAGYLVDNPTITLTLGLRTFAAGQPAIEEMVRLSEEVATLLTEGATRRARGKLSMEMIAGALSYTLHSEAIAGRAHLLEGLTEYLSYVVLAPYLGPEVAAQTVVRFREARERPATPSEPLAPPADASLGEVREHDADEQRDDDHDDQRSVTGAEDPVDLDLLEVEDSKKRDQHSQHHPSAGARQLTS
jgi:AcrR family transcriptional regulator